MSDEALPDAQLRVAFIYDCPTCGRENLVRVTVQELESPFGQAVVGNFSEEELADADGYGTVPSVVTCAGCRGRVRTLMPPDWECINDDDDDDDDDGVPWRG